VPSLRQPRESCEPNETISKQVTALKFFKFCKFCLKNPPQHAKAENQYDGEKAPLCSPTGKNAALIRMATIFRILDFILNRPAIPTTLFAIWLAILYHVSNSVPTEMPQMVVPQQDKILHFVFFLGGGTVLAASLSLLAKLQGIRLLLAVALIMGLLGALDEYNQQFIPGRSGLSLEDWIADMSGALAGVVLLRVLVAKLQTKEINEA
jgi:VanZ family protein